MTTPPQPPPGPPPPSVPGVPAPEPGARPNFLVRRAAVVSGLAVLLLGLGLYAAAWASAGAGVLRGTTVLGIEIGGLSKPAAAAKLAEQLPAALNREITVVAGPKTFRVDAISSGLAIDAGRTIEQASGRSLNPGVLFPALFGAKEELAPVLSVDTAALEARVAKMAEKVDRKLREGRITFAGGEAKVRKARDGRQLVTEETAAALREAIESGTTEVTAPVEISPPVIGNAEVDRVMREFAGPAMSAPVTVTLDGGRVVLSPARLDDYLKIRAAGSVLTPEVDTDAMAADLAEDNENLVIPPKDASFIFVKGKPKLVPGENGERIDEVSFDPLMRAALVAAAPRSLVADVLPAEPELTTLEAQNLGITEQISTFRTNYPIARYRITNIGRAAELMNESLVLPGETWSLNDTVGERTEANGFVKGFVIQDGVFAEDLGGGVSQAATTVFNAVFFAGLEDVEHHPHSLYIGRYPAGREATVAFGSKDLRFRNDAPTGVLIRATHQPGHIRVSIWGTKQFDRIESVSGPRHNFRTPDTIRSAGKDCMSQAPVSGFDIDVTRVFYRDGKVVRREKFQATYKATDRIVCT